LKEVGEKKKRGKRKMVFMDKREQNKERKEQGQRY
jgi:hypothetical protein